MNELLVEISRTFAYGQKDETLVTGRAAYYMPNLFREGFRTFEAATGILGHVIHIFLHHGGPGRGSDKIEANSRILDP